MHLEKPLIKELGEAGDLCWESILRKILTGLAKALTDTLIHGERYYRSTVPDWVMKEMENVYFPNYPGAITSGSGGGYIIVVSAKEVAGSIRIRVRY